MIFQSIKLISFTSKQLDFRTNNKRFILSLLIV